MELSFRNCLEYIYKWYLVRALGHLLLETCCSPYPLIKYREGVYCPIGSPRVTKGGQMLPWVRGGPKAVFDRMAEQILKTLITTEQLV